jgi:hypothetical protein
MTSDIGEAPVSPKKLKNITGVIFGLSTTWFLVLFVTMIIVASFLIVLILSPGWFKLIPVVGIFMVSGVWYFKLSDDTKLENLVNTVQYYISVHNGEHQVLRFEDKNIKILKRFLGIIKGYDDGRIEYLNNVYFFLVEYYPRNITDDEWDDYQFNVISFLKSFEEDKIYKFDMTAITKSNADYEQKLLDKKNQPGIHKATEEHLQSIIDSMQNNTQNIGHEYLMMRELGTFDNPEKSEDAMKSAIEGLRYQFNSLKIPFRVITSEVEMTLMIYNKLNGGRLK